MHLHIHILFTIRMKNIYTCLLLFLLIASAPAVAQGVESYLIYWPFNGTKVGISNNTNFYTQDALISEPITNPPFVTVQGTNQALSTIGWPNEVREDSYVEVEMTPIQFKYSISRFYARVKRNANGPRKIRMTLALTKANSFDDSVRINIATYDLPTEEYTDIFFTTTQLAYQESTYMFRFHAFEATAPDGELLIDSVAVSGERYLDVLPVTLTYFKVQTTGNQVELGWETSWERNSREFIIQRSGDLKEWGNIGTVPAAGESDGRLQYSFIDTSPLLGINYYRLRSEDKDDTYEYSNTKDAIYRPDQPQLLVSPNPVMTNEAIRIRTWQIDTESLRLTSLLGQSIPFRLHKVNSDSWDIKPAAPLAPGFYFLTVDQPGEPLTIRVMVP